MPRTASRADRTRTPRRKDPAGLVGCFFHSFSEQGAVHWQGEIMAEPAPGLYLVRLFSWLLGNESCRKLVLLTDMAAWQLYASHEQMNRTYEDVFAPRERAKKEMQSHEAA